MKRRTFVSLAASMLAAPWVSRLHAAESSTIYYNSNDKMDDSSLAAKALKLALSKISKPYELKPSPIGYPTQTGLLNGFKSGGDIDICWVGVDKLFWDATLPVPFPIDGGLLGYRLGLINAERQKDFSAVKSIEDLRRFIAIQGPGWGDIDILRNAGITVRTGLYKNLFRMTTSGRADFFPRAAFEAINEQRQRAELLPQLAVEKSLIVKYRFAFMFFVNKKRPELNSDILAGLEAAFKDGSYQAMFEADANISVALKEGNLSNRKLIEIANPGLPGGVDAIDARYWYKV